MTEMANQIKSRFRGALIGVLVGDCYGAPMENFSRIDPHTVLECIENMSKRTTDDFPLKYTDDTAMTISTCKSLQQNNGFNPRHLAREYTDSYFKEPNRGYGASVRTVFKMLRATECCDPFGPAANQFDGVGSFGNGAAMRCVGIGLFAHKKQLDDQRAIELTENCSRITHSHIYGIHGAALLVMAVRYVLNKEQETLDENEFLKYLIRIMAHLEDNGSQVFTDKLKSISSVLEKLSVSGTDVSQAEIVRLLGNDVTAPNSVPLAIYSFVRGISKFTDSYRVDNEFMRTLHWAISCGGDTDTIAAMACGLSGAYLGIEKIPENIYNKCESWQEILTMADEMAA